MGNKTFAVIFVFLFIAVSTGCATSTSQQTEGLTQGLLLAEPLPVDQRIQFAIARYNQILLQPSLADDERAELFYKRGIVYDRAGLPNLAEFDFSQAVNLKADMAEAYNSLGVHLIQKREFDRAYEAFDSTLDIEPSYDYALLNRGIALYYAGRPELGAADLDDFYRKDTSDPFRVLWAYHGSAEVDALAAKLELLKRKQALSSDHWAVSIIDLHLDLGSEIDVFNHLVQGVTSSSELTQRLCEAYFYLGKYHAFLGNHGVALNYFKLSLSTNVYEYVEHRYARLEMAKIRESIVANP
ncbi:lipoprotein NlpI [Alteromonas sp. 5E99-2]|uniref:lipoprotein NlpI n=1 Tax=Alteromonas sp. 5E99-2 TaxID=2817683 RepID=UPI001A981F59|nr:lipoprotein NlpI [Alteromonas sp. 5E99-2]MBO1255608.1 lipoprotein NlpI [Alteromonas sp. 5E99-2]